MRFPVRGPSFQLAALALVVLSLSATGFLMARMLQAPEAATDSGAGGSPEPRPQASHLFLEWPHDASPDLVLLLSGEQHGYIQPCGCSKPQYGGLERRFNLLKSLIQGHGWHVVPLDLGDIAQHSGPQALLKYKYSMEALHQLNYQAVSVGMNEMTMPLLDALAQYTLNSPQSPRVLVSNLQDKETNFPDMIGSWKVVGGAGQEPKVGVVGVVASSVGGPAQKLDRDVLRFQPAQNALNDTLRDGKFLAQTDLLALLFQGSLEEAQACAKQFPQFRIILCLTKEEEPPANPTMVGNTMIINVGHKGRYVGLVGIYRTNKPGQPFDLYYQLMQVGPEYETAQGKDADNPILALLENYTQEVRRGNYLAHYPKTLHPVQRQFPKATYVGSEVCQKCHPSAYQVWKNTPHAHAYQTLVDAKRPALRQYDGECVVCHVTGFDYQSGFTDEMKTPHLENNGCENCHGPCSLHVKGDKTPPMLAAINPFKAQPAETPDEKKARLLRIDMACQKCHDIDNDVHWDFKKWAKIVHMTPPEEK